MDFAEIAAALADVGAFLSGIGDFTSGSADLTGGFVGEWNEDYTERFLTEGYGFIGSVDFFSTNGSIS
ncbi:hypothetical protein [Hoyosella subflava]|uniref:Uncharacterized protein n=1 Tax=Hoyosella subflava (strain DSM 45089 / JCM 17490 / NBRC 109087 / DQS3-9A1) TaxID=443218 RepID=F6EM55_HOYSD|nr:hypothetical protein [Hoyosella subflava]AEF39261.1 hypothetical protein AS9A_0809 [Hoyosella subflava DQS3-9A1]